MLQPEVIRDKSLMREWSRSRRFDGKTLALVPTMGFLHEGHLSLVRTAKSVADATVVSIYVNPGQFAPSEDLASYPSDLCGDLRKLAGAGVDAVFCPADIYLSSAGNVSALHNGAVGRDRDAASCLEDGGSGHETWIRVERLEKGMCGKSRPVFFRGVATVVAKLFNIVEPDVAVFGKKDYQQWRVICRMVRDLDFPIKIIGSEIERESDGLAMSSRNIHLSPEQREKKNRKTCRTMNKKVSSSPFSSIAMPITLEETNMCLMALSINRSLSKAKLLAEKGQIRCQSMKDLVKQIISEAGGKIDYVEIAEQQSLKPVEEVTCPIVLCVAAWFGEVRLIDNMEINI